MQDHFSSSGPGKRKLGGETVNRRNSERMIFSAVAEVTESVSKARLSVRMGDLSLHGCYADTLTVFPPGTLVQVSIRHANLHFLAKAKVVYSKQGMGMGMSFEDLPPDMGAVLKSWISDVAGGIPQAEIETSIQAGEQTPRAERNTVSRLIDLLMRKGLLTSTEGSDLLSEMQRTSRK